MWNLSPRFRLFTVSFLSADSCHFLFLQSSHSAQRSLQSRASSLCGRTRSGRSFGFVRVAVRQPPATGSAPRSLQQTDPRHWPFSLTATGPPPPQLQPDQQPPPPQAFGPGQRVGGCPQGELRGALPGARQGFRGGCERGVWTPAGVGGHQEEPGSVQRVGG